MTTREKIAANKGQLTHFDREGNPIEGEAEVEHRCGFGPCFSPQCIQKLASKKAFMAVFSFLAVVQGMTWAYFTATITTLEKRFKISSSSTGIVMTGNEISQILFSIVLSYYGGKGHRPRWIAVGVMFSALSAFVLASPHAFYGPGIDALSLTEEFGQLYDPHWEPPKRLDSNSSTPSRRGKVQMCMRGLTLNGSFNGDNCDAADRTILPLILIFSSQFIMGIGVLLFFSLGGPYLDDNVEKTKSPMLFGITMSLRLVGPTLGWFFAAACLKIYIAPSLTPIMTNEDPKWLGAWWLGWVVLGSLMLLTSFTIAMFPRELPRAVLKKRLKANMRGSQGSLASARMGSQVIHTAEKAEEGGGIPKLSDIPRAVKVLLKNKVNLYNNFAAVFYLFSAIGYWTYMPKYLETIFLQTAVKSAAISGIISIFFQAIGLLFSGWLISKYQPRARVLAGWNAILGILYVLVKISFTQMGCESGTPNFGVQDPETSVWNLTAPCNVDCSCKVNKIQPVCWKEQNQIFYSACHAGCTSFANGTISNCACIPDPTAVLSQGPCNEDCFRTFMMFLAVNALIKLLDSTGRIGNMLVGYRCVDPKDKSLAIGLSIFLISLFAMMPAPIVFGRIFDSVCLVWGTKCGGRGNCWLYEGSRLRYMFNLTAAAFTGLGALFDILVWYYVKDLDLYDEEKNVRQREEKEMSKKGMHANAESEADSDDNN